MAQRQEEKKEEQIGKQVAEGLFAGLGLVNDTCVTILTFLSITQIEERTPELSAPVKAAIWRILFTRHFPHRVITAPAPNYQVEYYQAEKEEYDFPEIKLQDIASLTPQQKKLFRIVKGGDIEEFEQENISLEALYNSFKDKNHRTFFYWARECGRDLLLEHIYELALINGSLPANSTLLHWAALTNQTATLKKLADGKFNRLNLTDVNGATPPHKAAVSGHMDLVCQFGPIDSKMVSICAYLSYLEKIKHLLTPELMNDPKRPQSTLHDAASFGQTHSTRVLLEAKADTEWTNSKGATAIHIAAQFNYQQTLQLLLTQNANAEAKMPNKETPLYLAAREGQVEATNLLLESKANVDTQKDDGYTPLLAAASGGHTQIVRLLLAAKADTKPQELKTGDTALMWSAYKRDHEAVKALLDEGAEIETRNHKDKTALYEAVEFGNENTKVISHLLNANADTTVTLPSGRTLLAAASTCLSNLQLILKKQAEIYARRKGISLNRISSLYNLDGKNVIRGMKEIMENELPVEAKQNHQHPLKKLQIYFENRSEDSDNYLSYIWLPFFGYKYFGFNRCDKLEAAFILFNNILHNRSIEDLEQIYPALDQGSLGKIYRECIGLHRPMVAAAPASRP